MYMGHLALALVGKRSLPTVPLAALAVATVWLDAVDVAFTLAGAPAQVGLWSHTLPAVAVWSVAAFAVGALWRGAAVGAWLAALTGSHALVDYVTSRLALWPGGPRVGFHLYRFRLADLLLEGALVTACWLVYRGGLPAAQRGRWPAWAMLGLLLTFQAGFALTGIGA